MTFDKQQVQIIHLSDIHFGRKHRHQARRAATPGASMDPSFPTLLAQMRKALKPDPALGPCLVVLSGDFTEVADSDEFKAAVELSRGLLDHFLGNEQAISSLFVTCGNHDVDWSKATPEERLVPYRNYFLEKLFGVVAAEADVRQGFTVTVTREPVPLIVVSINSSMFVRNEEPDSHIGRYSSEQLHALQGQLASIDEETLRRAIKIVITHHHPIMLPPLKESDRAYDAIEEAGQFISILRKFGFHLLLHGHKHLPLTAGLDYRIGFTREQDHDMVLVAGGSVGSLDLPRDCTNTYNHIVVKWDVPHQRLRVHTTTFGLNTCDDRRVDLLPQDWSWEILRRDDRIANFNETERNYFIPRFQARVQDSSDRESNDRRKGEYVRLRGNLLVLEKRPSLSAIQNYEAVFKLEQKDENSEVPVRVVYRAGMMFPVLELDESAAPNYEGVYHYYGGFMIEAELWFRDCEEPERAFLCAPMTL